MLSKRLGASIVDGVVLGMRIAKNDEAAVRESTCWNGSFKRGRHGPGVSGHRHEAQPRIRR